MNLPGNHSTQQVNESDVAIVGMSCRFPGAETIDAFWQNLCNGIESISCFSDQDLDLIDFSLLNDPNYVKAGGVLSQIDLFDADFFGYSAKEAEIIDPQQRIFLECAWEALESAGYNPETHKDLVGVYAGSSLSTYLINQVCPNQGFSPQRPYLSHRLFRTASHLHLEQGNGGDHLPMRVSYKLGLTGPSVNVQSTCSTSLVAVHLACQSLQCGECDVALAGGVSIFVPHRVGYLYREGMILSPDGHCRAFDADAQGTVFGNGAGVVVLKLLSAALADGDRIDAVIKGTAVNNDGQHRMSYTAPSVAGQVAVISEALAVAEIDASTVSYVEAHGTGTTLGDPIEITALTQAFRQSTDHPYKNSFCAIGSVKTNIGHLDDAAGIAGLIKTVLSLKHRAIPPSLNFSRPNPNIDFANTPFYVNTKLAEWNPESLPRHAGVSSFGMGGTNCHVVLAEAPQTAPLDFMERQWHLFTLAAKTKTALGDLARRYVEYLGNNPHTDLGDICFTVNTGRKHFQYRSAIVTHSHADLRSQLQSLIQDEPSQHSQAPRLRTETAKRIGWLFTGQGCQYPGMGHQLYQTQLTFRKILDRCNEILSDHLDISLLEILYSDRNFNLDNTAYTQPALFALEYALAQLWQSWGIEPHVVMGHSVGEYVAACIAGVFSLEDGLKLIAHRGRLMQALPQNGEMVALLASGADVFSAIRSYGQQVAVAAINGPQNMVISGHRDAVQAVCATLESQGVKTKKLSVSHAFHSPLMEPMLAEFKQIAQQISFSPPQIPLISNVTGELIAEAIATPEYWCRHIQQPVMFAASMNQLAQQNVDVFLEMGPKPVLLGMGHQCLPTTYTGVWLPSLRAEQDDGQTLLTSLAALYRQGVAIDWQRFDQDFPRQRVRLPTYPFQRRRYWVDAPAVNPTPSVTSSRSQHPLLGTPLSLAGTQELRFQGQISQHFPAWLGDHHVFGTPVLPGTAYLEMALAAGAAIVPTAQQYRLTGVTLQQALLLSEQGDAKSVQTVLQPTGATAYTFQIFSLDASGEATPGQPAWLLHAAGTLYLEATVIPDLVNLLELQHQITEEVEVTQLYHKFQQQQIDYGASFQAVKQVWRHQDSALGHIVLPQSVATNLNSYQLHPVLLDTCLQILDAILLEDQQHTYVPVVFQEVCFLGQPSAEMWCHARLYPRESDRPHTLKADLKLLDPQGRLVAEINGLQLQRVHRQTMLGKTQTPVQDWLYEVEWRPQNRQDLNRQDLLTHDRPQPRQWLIFTDSPIGQDLAALLRNQGDLCILVFPGQDYEAISTQEYRINPACPDHFQQLLTSVPLMQGIVHTWGSEPPAALTPDALSHAALRNCGSALHLVQSLVKSHTLPPLWMITQGAQAIIPDQAVQAVVPSLIWGLGKTITLEHPNLRVIRIDLDPHSPAIESAQALLAEVLPRLPIDTAEAIEDQIAYRHQSRYVARLVRRATSRGASGTALVIPDQPFRLTIAERGTPDNLQLQRIDRQPPIAGEVEIRVHATGLNFIDVLNTLGLYPGEPPLGIECAGEIVSKGAGVTGLEIGDAVIAIARGSFSQYVTVDANLVVLKPRHLSFVEAATLPESFLTAYWSLHHLAKITPGDRVLIHAAAGGVGQAAVQLALQAGAEVFATASPSKWPALQTLGVKAVMNSRTLDFAEEVMALTQGQGVDIILNSLTGEGFIAKSLSVLAPNGRFLELAKRDIWSPEQMAERRSDVSYFMVNTTKACQETAQKIQSMLRHLMQQFETQDLKPLSKTVFPVQSAVSAFRYMQQAKHIGKIVLTWQPVVVQADSSYLITGGYGGLGLLVARWLVEQGARHLILLGRSGVSATIAPQISDLEQAGATITTIQADVSDLAQMQIVFSNLAQTAPPLRGIIHAAGVLDDGILQSQTWQRFTQVMAPKVQGAWNLHTLSRDQPLDFFVLFASSASLLGAAGQANYVAANAFLDALASYRRGQGLPGLSIDWGPWAEVGMTAKLQLSDRLRQKGEDSISPQQGLQILGMLLQERPVQVGVMPIDWSRFLARQRPIAPFFTEVHQTLPQQVGQPSRMEFRQHLMTLPLLERRVTLSTHLCTQVAKVLGIATPQQVSKSERLVDLGLDSLMAIEFLSLVQSSLGGSLSSALLFDYPTVDALVDYLFQEFAIPDAANRGSQTAEPPRKDADLAINHPAIPNHSTVIGIQPYGTKPPFFCVAGILGSVFDFYSLARYLGADQPFYGLRSLGLLAGEQPLMQMADIAAHHIKAIQAIQPDGPYQLGGHSFGGKVAFEMAQQLRHQGQDVSLVVIMDIPAVAMGSDRGAATWDDIQYIIKLAEIYQGISDQRLEISRQILQGLDAVAQLNLLSGELQKIGQKLTPTSLKQLFAVYRANMLADTAYIPSLGDSPISLLRARDIGRFDFLPDTAATQHDPSWGWHQVSTHPIQLDLVPGNHFTMIKEPHVQVLAQQLKIDRES